MWYGLGTSIGLNSLPTISLKHVVIDIQIYIYDFIEASMSMADYNIEYYTINSHRV